MDPIRKLTGVGSETIAELDPPALTMREALLRTLDQTRRVKRAMLARGDFSRLEFHNVVFTMSDMTGCDFTHTIFNDCDLTKCKFTDAVFDQTIFNGTVLFMSNVNGVEFNECVYAPRGRTPLRLHGPVKMIHSPDDPWPIMLASDGMAVCDEVHGYDHWGTLSQRDAVAMGGKVAAGYRTGRYQDILDEADRMFGWRSRPGRGNPNV